jgi:hypothetical protein
MERLKALWLYRGQEVPLELVKAEAGSTAPKHGAPVRRQLSSGLTEALSQVKVEELMPLARADVVVRVVVKELPTYNYVGQVVVVVKPHKPLHLLGALVTELET